MTQAVVEQRITVSASGFANPINIPSNAEAASHVRVYGDDTLLTVGVDYTLDGVDDLGNLDEIAGVDVYIENDVLVAGLYDTFTVEHVPPLEQDADLSGGGQFGAAFEAAIDAIMRRVQSIMQVFTARSLRLPVSSINVDTTLPHPEDRRGLVWAQDENGFYLTNTYEDPDTEPLAAAEEAAAAAELAAEDAETALASTLVVKSDTQAIADAASDSADRAEAAAAEAGDLSALLNFLWPVGASVMFNGTSAPSNFLKENGAAVSRTTYAALFAVIGTTYGAGDGSTTFNLPDSRGEFFRGLDDGRGVDTDRTLASAQSDLIKNHTHPATAANSGSHVHGKTHTDPGFAAIGNYPSASSSSTSARNINTNSGGDHTHTITVGNNTGGGAETRPRNVAKLVCIKY